MSVRQRRLQRMSRANNPLVNNRRRRQEPVPEPEAVENAENAPVAVADRPAIACVDLTEEDDDITPSIVDLTNSADNSVIVLSSTPPAPPRRPPRLPSIDADDIEVLHHTAATIDVTTINRPRPQQSAVGLPHFGVNSSPIVLSASSSASTSSSVSNGPNITCPICMDTHSQIIGRNDIMMSTVCGHVFCKKCITATIASQRLCPTCRRKLTAKSIHPVFL